jgi:hypothetical protein
MGAPSPMSVAKKALRAAKSADKRSKKALKRNQRRGHRGFAGVIGPAGPAGTDGVNGANGSSGVPGIPGSTGASGSTGATGAAGSARAYAEVSSATASLVSARTRGFTGLSRPSTGLYCLATDPSLAIDPETVAAVASIEWGTSGAGAHGGSAEVHGLASASCSLGEFAIHTYDASAVASNTVSFHLVVP